MHVGQLNLVGQQFLDRRAPLGAQLHLDQNVGVGGSVRILLDHAVDDQLLQPLAEVGGPCAHRQLGDGHHVLLHLPQALDAELLCGDFGDGALEAARVGDELALQPLARVQPLQNRVLQLGRVVGGHEGGVAGADAAAAIYENHGEHGAVPVRLHGHAVVVAVVQAVKVVARDQRRHVGLQIGVDVAGRRGILAALQPRAELPLRDQPGQVIGAHEVLRHAHNGVVQGRLAVVVARVLAHVARQLRHPNLRLQVALERREQDLALRRLEAVHDVGDGALQIVV